MIRVVLLAILVSWTVGVTIHSHGGITTLNPKEFNWHKIISCQSDVPFDSCEWRQNNSTKKCLFVTHPNTGRADRHNCSQQLVTRIRFAGNMSANLCAMALAYVKEEDHGDWTCNMTLKNSPANQRSRIQKLYVSTEQSFVPVNPLASTWTPTTKSGASFTRCMETYSPTKREMTFVDRECSNEIQRYATFAGDYSRQLCILELNDFYGLNRTEWHHCWLEEPVPFTTKNGTLQNATFIHLKSDWVPATNDRTMVRLPLHPGAPLMFIDLAELPQAFPMPDGEFPDPKLARNSSSTTTAPSDDKNQTSNNVIQEPQPSSKDAYISGLVAALVATLAIVGLLSIVVFRKSKGGNQEIQWQEMVEDTTENSV